MLHFKNIIIVKSKIRMIFEGIFCCPNPTKFLIVTFLHRQTMLKDTILHTNNELTFYEI